MKERIRMLGEGKRRGKKNTLDWEMKERVRMLGERREEERRWKDDACT